MEKISGIVKASPRLTSVDLKDAAPVRPGVPSFGRPEGISSLTQASSFGATAPRSAGIQADLSDWRSKDAQNAAMAAELSNRFFIKNTTAAEPIRPSESGPVIGPMHLSGVASKPTGFKSEAVTRPGPTSGFSSHFAETDEFAEHSLQQPEGLYPKGSFIDRTA